MKYKIEVERITPPKEGEKYDQTETIYKQIFEVKDELDFGERDMLVKIMDAVNK